MNPTELAASLKCLGNKLINVTGDPDKNTRKKLEDEFNCKVCEYHEFCNFMDVTAINLIKILAK
jgi:hypothetical protein